MIDTHRSIEAFGNIVAPVRTMPRDDEGLPTLVAARCGQRGGQIRGPRGEEIPHLGSDLLASMLQVIDFEGTWRIAILALSRTIHLIRKAEVLQ